MSIISSKYYSTNDLIPTTNQIKYLTSLCSVIINLNSENYSLALTIAFDNYELLCYNHNI